jgi:oligoendopeptidase F
MSEPTEPANSALGIRWDLSDLFTSHNDPQIEVALNDCQRRAQDFARFRNMFSVPGGPTATTLLEALRELEQIEETLSLVANYASLLYAADSLNPAYQAFDQRVEQRVTAIRNSLLFFPLEWMKLPDRMAEQLMKDPAVNTYRHYLDVSRRFRPHKLTEPEEKIVNEKDMTGRNAFGRLFSEITSALVFRIEQEGRKRELTLSEILSLLHHSDRTLRQTAWNALFVELSKQADVLTFIYDNLILDHLVMDRLRHYPDPMLERHLTNEIDATVVDVMMKTTESNYIIAQNYFRLKAKLLGLRRIALFDQYAPVGESLPELSFSRAQEMILEAFGSFTPMFSSIAAEFFTKHWIDAEIRKGKRSGAFCASPSPKLHPYILCNYTDNLRDVLTVAHELGHGLHGYLSRQQSFLNYDTPLTTAETASVFAEMLVFEHLLEHEPSAKVQVALIAAKLEDTFGTVFRQNVLTSFEQAVFTKRHEGRLTNKEFGDAWIEANSRYYGHAVEIDERYRWGWSYIPHFIHTRFYCYSYVFGELLVLSLYRMYREQGKAFVAKYLALLEAGGSDSPEMLLRSLAVDIHDRQFWQKGFDEIHALVRRLEGLVEQIGGSC